MHSKENKVNGYLKDDLFVTVNKNKLKDFKVLLNYNGPIKAPIKKDQEIGSISIENGEEKISIPVFSSKKVKKVNFIKSLFLSFNYMIWGDA